MHAGDDSDVQKGRIKKGKGWIGEKKRKRDKLLLPPLHEEKGVKEEKEKKKEKAD